MTERAQKIWDTYINGYSEALMTPVENFSTYLDNDSRKIIASVLRVLADNVAPDDYRCFYGDKEYDAGMEGRNDEIREAILNIATELETL